MNALSMLGRVGVTLGKRGPWARLRGLAMAVGVVTMCLGLGALVLQSQYVKSRDMRADAIRPNYAPSMNGASALYSFDGFTQLQDRPVTVISIWPLTPNAPLPPGVGRWPAPGEAVVSPAVLRDLSPSNKDLFGRVSGVIGAAGVEVPGERRIYLRPTAQAFAPAEMKPISGFNGHPSYGYGFGIGVLYAASLWQAYGLILAALLVPGFVTVALATGLDGEARERRARLLTAMGAGRRQRAVVDLAEAAPALAAGAVLAALVLATLCARNIRIPALDATLAASDARSALPILVAAVAMAVLLAVSVIVLARVTPRPRRRNRSLLAHDERRMTTRAACCLLFAVATVWLPTQSQSAPFRTLTYGAGVVLVGITLPALVSVLLGALGELTAWWGLRRGLAGWLLGGRRLQRFPVRTSRLALGVCFGVLMIGQVQLWASQFGQQYEQALGVRRDIGTSIVESQATSYGPGMQRFLTALPKEAHPLWVSTEQGTDGGTASTLWTGSCDSLTALGLPCSSGPAHLRNPSPLLRMMLRWGSPLGNVQIQRNGNPSLPALAKADAELMLVSSSGKLPLNQLQRVGYRLVPGGVQLDGLGQGWVTSGVNVKIRAGWAVTLGWYGVASLVVATGCAMAGDVITSRRNLAPLLALTDSRRWLVAVSLIRTTVPLAVAGGLGATMYLTLPSGIFDGPLTVSPSGRLAAVSAIGALSMGLLVAAWTTREILRAGRVWPPNLHS